MAERRTPAEYASEIRAARDRLVEFAERCSDDDWRARLPGDDPRPVGVIVDHVADAYGYIGDFVRTVLRGESLAVDGALIDELNAKHASAYTGVTRMAAIEHLQRRGDAFIELISALGDGDLELGDGRVGRLAAIAIRHADDHRSDVEACLADR
ncbi:MAG TPA: DinB family protein [Candidatus Dormibacteraeota bacterium]|nr:DinB family protein [Candidatus Dormibacteraeota bacterium]